MIKAGALPIHGSMIKITLKGGKQVHLVIMGDSGAGKSESIEAFRLLAKEYLESITVIFDDMGTLFYNGTATSARVEPKSGRSSVSTIWIKAMLSLILMML
jgi:serine kinase of HPr protein (carbohydrate metabolism regulator)